ncbi:hypothetical protein IWQ62_005786 [Dispira parvispora]|uniref:N-acetyltransferase domain-containing protein n=1 Tax=Dispira parvispora TaxID=1520584 RepID=A0A9W8AQB1_9FUNG|nr:hypothetical protein IWQ62_005786 [Dispira parvispora]
MTDPAKGKAPDATRLFRVLNPELFFPKNRGVMVFGLVTFSAVTAYFAWKEAKQQVEQPVKPIHEGPTLPTYQERMQQRQQEQARTKTGEAQCQAIERRIFPKTEAMDLAQQLCKPGTFMVVTVLVAHRDTVVSTRNTPVKGQPRPSPSPSSHSVSPVAVGYALYTIVKLDSSARLIKLAVDKRCQQQGLGHQLMASIIARIDQHPLRVIRIRLHVDPLRTTAYRLYLAHGFRKRRVIPAYYGLQRDAHVLEREYPPQQ